MRIISFKGTTPLIDKDVYLSEDCVLIGNVQIAKQSAIFFKSVLRGDINPIIVGENTNIQEHCTLHTSRDLGPCAVGNNVTVGHRVILHGCTVNDNVIVGMGSTILDQALIGKNCIIGAHSLITKSTVIPDGHLVMGSPAKVIRALSEKEINSIHESAKHYYLLSLEYRKNS